VKLSRAEADIFSAKQDTEDYKERVKKLKQKCKEVEGKEDAHGSTAVSERVLIENQDLKAKIEKLAEKLNSKDTRIKSLKAKILTKEQVEKFKEIKAERKQFEAKAEKYKKELAKVKQQLAAVSTDKDNNNPTVDLSEFQNLQQKYEKLENKVRRFNDHCEQMDKEKSVIMDLIKSSIQEDGKDMTKDFNGAVVELCERLETLEEQCDALKQENITAKVSLENQLTKIKAALENETEMNRHLETKLKESEGKFLPLKQKYDTLQQLTEDMKRSADELEYEKNRQISYLESENLQCLGELKLKKKEIQSLKVERNTEIYDEPTEDIGSIISMKLSSLECDKEKLSSLESDKENCPNVNTIMSPNRDAKLGSQTKRSIGLGSGEGVTNDEHTNECNQS